MRIGAVVLASGIGERFGGNKLLAPFGDKPLIAGVLCALPEPLFAKRLVVTRSEDIADFALSMGYETRVHDLPVVNDTIRIGITSMSDMDGCLFCVGDQPLLSKETVSRILSAFEAEPRHIFRACFGDAQGNPVLFPKELFSELQTLEKGRSGGAVISKHRDMVRKIEVSNELELFDVDTAADYERLIKEREASAAYR